MLENISHMKKTIDNILGLIKAGAAVRIAADDFRYSELQRIVTLAASNETHISIIVGNGVTFDELLHLAKISRGYLTIDLND